jgi:hypothetical protein
MKLCLDDNKLLQILVADDGESAREFSDDRAHLSGCSGCAERYQEIALENGSITSALTGAADHLNYRESARNLGILARFRDGLRTAMVFSAAAAFGGAAAFALLLALGWRPITERSEIARASVSNPASPIVASVNRNASQVVADDDSDSLPTAAGGLYNAEAITSDPLSDLVGSGSVSGANSDGGEDLLFCVPGEDGDICSPSGGQG